MELDEAIRKRRSIRAFTEEPVTDKELDTIIDAARYAPSSHGTEPWEFIIVKDKATIEKLSQTHQWSSFLKSAQVVIIACANLKRRDILFSAMVSVALAVENMLLKITELGLGSCWTYIMSPDEPGTEKYVKDTLELPDHIRPLCMLPIGHPDYTPKEKKLRQIEEIAHSEKYQE